MFRRQKLQLLGVPEKDIESVLFAHRFAQDAHRGQVRQSGELYITHPEQVALLLWKQFLDVDMLIAGLLHDVLEDTSVLAEDIKNAFGDAILFLVEALSKNLSTFHKYPQIEIADPVEKLLWAGEKDVRAVLIKLADRQHNMSTLMYKSTSSQIRISFETQCIFTPLNKLLMNETSVAAAQHQYNTFVTSVTNANEHSLKDRLLSSSFSNLSSGLFSMIYRNAESVVWAVEDWNTYVALVDNPSIRDKIIFLTLEGSAAWFRGQFILKGPLLEAFTNCKIDSYHSMNTIL